MNPKITNPNASKNWRKIEVTYLKKELPNLNHPMTDKSLIWHIVSFI